MPGSECYRPACLRVCVQCRQVPATALQLAAKDREVRELQEENSLLRQQVTEMEKALQMASDYHAATQAAHQVGTGTVHHVLWCSSSAAVDPSSWRPSTTSNGHLLRSC